MFSILGYLPCPSCVIQVMLFSFSPEVQETLSRVVPELLFGGISLHLVKFIHVHLYVALIVLYHVQHL